MARTGRSNEPRKCPHCGGDLPSEVAEYFWTFVDKTENCWLWTGPTDSRGYGRAWLGESQRTSCHRFSYELHHGPGSIPKGRHVLHLCDTPACVRPDHLSYGDHATNMREAAERGLMPSRENHPSAKLTAEQVLAIRQLYKEGFTQPALAKRYGVSRAHVGKLVRNERWR